MKKLHFRYLSAKNFLCFGAEGIEIYFDDFDQLVLVTGINLDMGGSNASGKSSIFDAISYILYGKTIKRPKQLDHGTVINSFSLKKLEAEVHLDEYRILRGREPNKLKVWRSANHLWDADSEITRGTMAETQKLIDEIVGLSHAAFCNVVVFADSNDHCFLELDTAGKRNVVENLLGLDKYREYHENAKEWLKSLKAAIKDFTKDYDHLQDEISAAQKRVQQVESQETQWKQSQTQNLLNLNQKLVQKQQELSSSDTSGLIAQYHASQRRLAELNASIPIDEQKRTIAVAAIEVAKTKLAESKQTQTENKLKLQECLFTIRDVQQKIGQSQALISSLGSLQEGQKCPVCYGSVERQNSVNVLLHEQNHLQQLQGILEKTISLSKVEQEKYDHRVGYLQKVESQIGEAERYLKSLETKIRQSQSEINQLLKVNKPDLGTRQQVLESEVSNLQQQITTQQTMKSPYEGILVTVQAEQQQKLDASAQTSLKLKTAEGLVPYFEYWVKAFGDKGIRKDVVDGIIPTLNSRITYWMQYLIDAKIELVFDNELQETIHRSGSEVFYHAMSSGEKRRLNLAVSQAFAYVMMLNCGNCPSLVFLDEITGGGIDLQGVTGVYNMIFELAKERQVFVTTHNQTLLEMLQGCREITLVKKNDISKMVLN